MRNVISFLVSREGKVCAKYGKYSRSELAKIFGVDKAQYWKYEIDLITRTLLRNFWMNFVPGAKFYNQAARGFFEECAGTPEKLMAYAQSGNWIKRSFLECLIGCDVYAQSGNWNERTFLELLTDSARAEYEKALGAILEAETKQVSDAATAKGSHGWSFCWVGRDKDSMKIWLGIFQNPDNRIKAWQR